MIFCMSEIKTKCECKREYPSSLKECVRKWELLLDGASVLQVWLIQSQMGLRWLGTCYLTCGLMTWPGKVGAWLARRWARFSNLRDGHDLGNFTCDLPNNRHNLGDIKHCLSNNEYGISAHGYDAKDVEHCLSNNGHNSFDCMHKTEDTSISYLLMCMALLAVGIVQEFWSMACPMENLAWTTWI